MFTHRITHATVTTTRRTTHVHLTHTHTLTHLRAPLSGLSGELRERPPRPGVYLIVHEVLEPLVEGGPDEDPVRESAAGVSRVERLVAVLLEPQPVQLLRDVVHRALAAEGGRVALHAAQSVHLSQGVWVSL